MLNQKNFFSFLCSVQSRILNRLWQWLKKCSGDASKFNALYKYYYVILWQRDSLVSIPRLKDAFAFSHDAQNTFSYTCCRTCIPLPYGLGAWEHGFNWQPEQRQFIGKEQGSNISDSKLQCLSNQEIYFPREQVFVLLSVVYIVIC